MWRTKSCMIDSSSVSARTKRSLTYSYFFMVYINHYYSTHLSNLRLFDDERITIHPCFIVNMENLHDQYLRMPSRTQQLLAHLYQDTLPSSLHALNDEYHSSRRLGERSIDDKGQATYTCSATNRWIVSKNGSSIRSMVTKPG